MSNSKLVKGRYYVERKRGEWESKPLFQRCLVNPKTQQIIKVGEPYFREPILVKGVYFVKEKMVKGVSKPLFQRCLVNRKTQKIIKVGEPYFWGNHDKEDSSVLLPVCEQCGHTVPDSVICAWCGAKLKEVA